MICLVRVIQPLQGGDSEQSYCFAPSAGDKRVLAPFMTFHCRRTNMCNKAMCKTVMSEVPAPGNTLWFSQPTLNTRTAPCEAASPSLA